MTQRRTAHVPDVDWLIVTVRGQKVLLDSGLARIYAVPTFRFNEAVKRNEHRFPPDFRFRLTQAEWGEVRTSRAQDSIPDPVIGLNSSQIAMSYGRHPLEEQFAESAKLEKAIRGNLERLGYGR